RRRASPGWRPATCSTAGDPAAGTRARMGRRAPRCQAWWRPVLASWRWHRFRARNTIPGSQRADGVDDLWVRPAAAQVPGQVVLDFVIVRVRILFEQLPGHQHEAWRAEPALKGGRGDESLLHGIELLAVGQALDRAHVGAVGEAGQIQAA